MKISFGFTLVIRRRRLSGGLNFFQARTRLGFPLASREHVNLLAPEGREGEQDAVWFCSGCSKNYAFTASGRWIELILQDFRQLARALH
jgi:hypothetical protein